MKAFKFLDGSGRSPVTGWRWVPGEWVEAAAVVPCAEGVHACLPEHLAYWLAEAMWEIELADDIVSSEHKLTARRGRLVAEVGGYRAALAELSATCAWRARDRAVAALRAAGDDPLAGRFAAATTLDELAALRRQDDSTTAGRAAGLAADVARFALRGRPQEAPFIAACSAGHAAAGETGDQASFDRAYAAERAFQSAWLTARLALPT